MSRSDGLYALASLDGAPLAAPDADALGLSVQEDTRFVAQSREQGARARPGDGRLFVGHLDEAADLAAALGLPPAASPVELVAAAFARHGDDAPALLLGEWAYLAWDDATETLTLAAADTLRDPMLFATDGRRVAVAPRLGALRRIGWVDATLGPGLLLAMGRSALRASIGDRSLLNGVRRVEAGTRVTIRRGEVRTSTRRPLVQPDRWRGSFDEAIEELDAVLRRIMRELLRRHQNSAILLSGGLDSSLLAVLAAAERAPGDRLVALTSAAPPGSGLPDEVEFSRSVADQAGIAIQPIVPGSDGDPYAPSLATMRWHNQPICSERHYLYDALHRAAAEQGATAVIDGCNGEMTVTGYPDDGGWRYRLRSAFELAMRLWRTQATPTESLADAFHVRLSADALAMAAANLGDLWRTPVVADDRHRRGGTWGYSVSVEKGLWLDTASPVAGLRTLVPYRDRRLLRLFAGMPYAFITHGGVTRAPARALLAGRVPESVRLRTRGRPFSPDHPIRLRRYADPARARLRDYAAAGVDAWLDLGWLDATLARIADGSAVDPVTRTQAQETACAAAFLTDWFAAA